MDYLTRNEQKSLLECYRLHNCKRFHSMNAAIKYTGHCRFTNCHSTALAFYSYRTRCFGYYPDADFLVVYPVVINNPSSSTMRQCNRFLSEIVKREGLTVKELQRSYNGLTDGKTVTYTHNLRVQFDDMSNSVLF